MIHFIPAWYHMNTWGEHEQFWYKVKEHSEFDDSVKQVQLFQRNNICPYEILILGHAPNFRHFLHRQGAFHAPYWSCFDAICQIKREHISLFSYRDLNWPRGIEFEFTPFVIVAYLNGIRYAQIEFGEDGNMILIWMYENGILARCNVYDDRGFVSKTAVYENGKGVYQDYLMENGMRKMRVFADGRVEINSSYPMYSINYNRESSDYKLERLNYGSLEEVVAEVFAKYVTFLDERDLFCIASHARHNRIVNKVLAGRNKIVSYFGNRVIFPLNEENEKLLSGSGYIVSDVNENTGRLTEYARKYCVPLKEITPFDSRTDFGISSKLSNQQILIPVDELQDDEFEAVVTILDEYLSENENAVINFFTKDAKYNRKEEILEKVKQCVPKSKCIKRYMVSQCIDEIEVNACVKNQRLIVNFSTAPELYLQIAAISAGIPQIVRTQTQYVEDGKNGYVINNLGELIEALNYYLDGMVNWNKAMICAYEMGQRYSTAALIEGWKEVIQTFGND